MSRVVKSVFKPIQTLFTSPKRLFRSGTKIGKSNWIADWAVPMILGAAGLGGAATGQPWWLAMPAGYGAWRSGQQAGGPGGPAYTPGGMAAGAVTGLAKGMVGGALGAGASATSAGAGSPWKRIGWGAKQYWGGVTGQPFTPAPTTGPGWAGDISGIPGEAPGAQFGAETMARLPVAPGVGGMPGIPGGPETGITGMTSPTAPVGWMDKMRQFGITPAGALAAGASLLARPPETEYTPTSEAVEQARQTIMEKYLGSEAAMQLPGAVSEEYYKMITTPLGQLWPIEKDAGWARTQKLVNESYDRAVEGIKESFAQAQGVGSSDYYEAINEAERNRVWELDVGKQQVEQSYFEQHVKVKQDALMGAAQQGQIDETIMFELAKLIKQDDALERAGVEQDYDTFQRIMGMIMAMGLQTPMPNISSMRA